jgi:hypothetical protein
MKAPWGYGRALALCLLLGAACGPIEYINQVTRKADTSVEAARAVEADKYSPYYYTLAVEYLHKARVEAAAADYQAANRFGKRAEEAAVKAKEEALARVGKPIEMFHPVVVPKAGEDASTGKTSDPVESNDLAPLVEDDEPAVDDSDDTDDSGDSDDTEGADDEMPEMKGTP